jgi:hypothetical protein
MTRIVIFVNKQKQMKKAIAIIVGIFIFAACSSSNENDNQENQVVVENCIYSYNSVTTKLDWTAYKFLRKAGVGGTFKTINVEGNLSGASPKAIIESLSFSIPVNSVETNDPGRNEKIANFFFGSLEGGELLSGKVVRLADDGMATLEIRMNGINKDVSGTYTLVDNIFNFSTDIDVLNWNAGLGIKKLNEACNDLHTDVENGDTESKLWPDVSIKLSIELTKKCD